MDWRIQYCENELLPIVSASIQISVKSLASQKQKIILKLIKQHKCNPEKKQNAGGSIVISGFKLYYRAAVTKTVWYWHRNRHTNQCDRIQDTDSNTHSCGHLTFDKSTQSTQRRKDSLSSIVLGKLIPTHKRVKLDLGYYSVQASIWMEQRP